MLQDPKRTPLPSLYVAECDYIRAWGSGGVNNKVKESYLSASTLNDVALLNRFIQV